MKDKMIQQLTDEINRQAEQFRQDKNAEETKKKLAEKERIKAIFNKAKANSEASSRSVSPKDSNLKSETSTAMVQSINKSLLQAQ